MQKPTRIQADIFFRLPVGEWVEPSDMKSKLPWLKFHELCTALAELSAAKHIEQTGETEDEPIIKYRRPKISQ